MRMNVICAPHDPITLLHSRLVKTHPLLDPDHPNVQQMFNKDTQNYRL